MIQIARTPRLTIRHFVEDDAAFIHRLLNEPGFITNIGDRGVRDDTTARTYLRDGPIESYRVNGYGTFMVESSADGAPIGMCGLTRKPWLDAPDLAYAFLQAAHGQGYATEAAHAVVDYATSQLDIRRLVAVVLPENTGSIRVLEKQGFRQAGTVEDPAAHVGLLLFERVADGGRC